MRLPRALKLSAIAFAFVVLIIGAFYFYAITPHASSAPVGSAQNLLDRADTLAWGNQWALAQPLYKQAEAKFEQQGQLSKALYARVSQIPPNESANSPLTIVSLTQDLARPEAAEPEIRLRILTIRGMLETNYNAAEALSTWQQVSTIARSLGHVSIASRALGEEGIASFMLGDTETAKKKVIGAWTLSKIENDPAATVRYASVFGAGLVQIHRYQEALTPLNEAIRIAGTHSGVAYPTIAVYAKIDALVGLHRLDEALEMANDSLTRLQPTPFDAHKAQVYLSRGNVYRERREWNAATEDYRDSVRYSTKIGNYRGIADASGLLAQAYVHAHDLPAALDAINAAIAANTKIPEELYLVPRNLATKAEILSQMGQAKDADDLYLKSIALVNGMIEHAPTMNVQRQLLAEMNNVYSGYFALLTSQKRYTEAFAILEQIRGRVETAALEHHNEVAHVPTPQEKELTRLNVALINSESPQQRETISNAIYHTELAMSPSEVEQETVIHPVQLTELQRALSRNSLLIEYVLAEPSSYALAITSTDVAALQLPSRTLIETDAKHYIGEIRGKKEDKKLAETLFGELLQPVKQYAEKTDLIVVPDGSLHLLPFAALSDHGSYVLSTHSVAVAPSSTVYSLIHNRAQDDTAATVSYLGVAAWTQSGDTRNPILRAISGPKRSELIPLPESKAEVESIARYLPPPGTILLGSKASEGNFKKLAASDPKVIHLALHGYVDLDYPDRSALIFAPEDSGKEDGLLQVREIRTMHLSSKLVTLSACSTGVGPVGEVGVANLVNAFIEAGADSVVSTLWDVEDESTEHFMMNFYSNLGLHKRKVDALRSSQLDLLQKGFVPYFWAGFQLAGDPNGNL
ncbi:CHAT domain-containing protein [Edaphobacter aggregans]|uniref:CHAT domain-containing protein n=1 Tax=Edaphobacter aggregans TaxID=570835 RepID=A0A3R9R5W7_9BACT|nr:CHAT domain-containing protein [Edaphobacter aggregans]RSL18680.1 CHAT domain-containing protein [Edaphobacter aggregans]